VSNTRGATDTGSTIAPAPARSAEEGATAVITHRVCNDKHPQYEQWLREIGPLCQSYPGHLDLHIVRPIPGVTETYTVIIRFDTQAHLKSWIESSTRADLIARVHPLLVTGDDFFISSGLDFWFAPPQAGATVPIRWKQFLVTWSAIYPLVLSVPLIVLPALRFAGIPTNHYFDVLVVTGAVVTLMVYVVMPRYTRLLRRWLFE
jgi:antibiotic biosynthesis monooxygenase (ABM) superfamily enzyme